MIAILSFMICLVASANTEFDQGVTFANHKQMDSAIVAFESVIAKEPRNASAYYNLGYCYFQQQKYGQAIWGFEKALQYDPKHSNALKNLEICHFKLALPSYEPIHSSLMRSLFSFGADNWSVTAILSSILVAISMLLLFSRKSVVVKRIAFISLFFFICIGFLSIYLAYAADKSFRESNAAIVIGKTIPTYLTESGEKSPITLTEGTRIMEIQKINKNYFQGLLLNGQEVMIDANEWRKL